MRSAPRQRVSAPFWLAPLLLACASEQPAQVSAFDSSAGRVVVTLLGDDFALLDGVRMPLDAAVLRLRLQVRAMTKDQLKCFVVKVVVDEDVPESAGKLVMEHKRRLLDELDVMEVGQVEL